MSFSSILLFFVTVWLLNSILYSAKPDDASYGDGTVSPPNGCNNCTICQYPCHPQPPPPSGYQSYGTPPPPQVAQGNCPPAPAAPVQCGQYAPPIPFYSPYNNYSGSDSFQIPMIKPFIFKGSSAVFLSLILLLVSLVWRNLTPRTPLLYFIIS